MALPRLHHVGIVVPTEQQAGDFMGLLGLEEAYRGFVEQYNALCIFTRGNGASPVELVVPFGGVLQGFNRGVGGLHHIALAVDSLQALSEKLAEQGMELLEPSAVRGAGPFLSNFLHPVHTQGIIVEFVQEIDPPDID